MPNSTSETSKALSATSSSSSPTPASPKPRQMTGDYLRALRAEPGGESRVREAMKSLPPIVPVSYLTKQPK